MQGRTGWELARQLKRTQVLDVMLRGFGARPLGIASPRPSPSPEAPPTTDEAISNEEVAQPELERRERGRKKGRKEKKRGRERRRSSGKQLGDAPAPAPAGTRRVVL